MATRPRQRYRVPDSAFWHSELTEVVSDAVSPLASDLREMKATLNSLQLNAISRSEVYDRPMIDEKLKGMVEEVAGVRKDFETFQANIYKLVSGVVLVGGFLILVAQHISVH